MGRLIGFLFLVALVVIGLSFAVLNSQPVALNYYLGERDIPLSIIVVVSVAVGAVVGVVVSAGMILRLRARSARLRRQLRDAENDMEQLRVLPLKD